MGHINADSRYSSPKSKKKEVAKKMKHLDKAPKGNDLKSPRTAKAAY